MRVGEALRLARRDVDLTRGVIRIRHPKFDRERLVPLHPSSTQALRRYVARRDRLCPNPGAEMFFISDTRIGASIRVCALDIRDCARDGRVSHDGR